MVIWPSFSARVMRPSSLSIVCIERIILDRRHERCLMAKRRRTTGGQLPKSKLSRGNKSAATRRVAPAAKLAALPDDALLETVQRQTFRYFWDGAHPVSGLAFDRRTAGKRADPDAPITIGGSGFG